MQRIVKFSQSFKSPGHKHNSTVRIGEFDQVSQNKSQRFSAHLGHHLSKHNLPQILLTGRKSLLISSAKHRQNWGSPRWQCILEMAVLTVG